MEIALKRILFSITFLSAFQIYGQTPYISGISKISGTVGEEITISGGNFSTDPDDWLVTFGAASVLASSASANAITAIIPAGSSTDQIVVTDVNSNISIYSQPIFYLSYGGAEGSFSNSRLNTLFTLDSDGTQAQDLCTCDFDGDGDNDVAITHVETSDISLFRNDADLAANVGDPVAFTKLSPISVSPLNSINIDCADINGDQRSEIVVSSSNVSGDRIYVIPNNGGMSFGTPVFYDIPRVGGTSEGLRRNPGKVVINDIDRDGKPDIVVLINSENTIDIFENTGTGTTIQFNSTPYQFSLGDADKLFGLDVADLNNDDLPDIGVVQDNSSDLFVLQNMSQPGNFNFREAIEFNVSGNMRHLKFGDFDQDGDNDVAMTARLQGNLLILKNSTQSTGGTIAFDEASEVISGMNQPWGLDVGDVEGDGDLDVIISSNSTSEDALYVIENNGSFSGNLFESTPISLSLSSNSKHVRLADLNMDARPDFVFTHNASAGVSGQLGALENRNCITPLITPNNGGTVEVCVGSSVDLSATLLADGLAHEWQESEVATGGTNDTETVSTAGTYRVLTPDLPGCESTASSPVVVSFTTTTFENPTIAAVATPICTQTDLNLTTDALTMVTAADVTFFWEGPNGFASNQQSPTISNATASNSGTYSLYMVHNTEGCISTVDTRDITITNVPSIAIINNDGAAYCNDGMSSIDLSVTDVTDKDATANFQWYLDETAISGQTGLTYNLSAPGSYKARITNSEGCFLETAIETISELSTPISAFEIDTAVCFETVQTFTASSTGTVGLLASFVHNWDFGDGESTTGSGIERAYGAVGAYEVTLNSKYDIVSDDNCNYTAAVVNIEVVAPPSGDGLELIMSQNEDPNSFQKCPSGVIRLEVSGGPYDSLAWYSTNQQLSEEETYRVETPTDSIYARLTNTVGCTFNTNPVDVINIPGAGVSITSSRAIETDDDGGKFITMENGQTSVNLSVDGTAPAWSPTSIFQDTTAVDVVVYPLQANQSVYVTATDVFNCIEQDSIRVVTPPLQADKNFSPNGDGMNDCWEVANARGNACEISIYDAKGRKIKFFKSGADELNEDNCVWDGTSDGNTKMPAGVYYYVAKCTGTNQRNSGGTILLAR